MNIEGYANTRKRLFVLSWGLLVALCLSTGLSAQSDAHFSQYLHTPLFLNPARAGLINSDARFIANYRTQWGSVTVPFTTAGLSYDMKIPRYFGGNCSYFGAGLLLVGEEAGDSQFRNVSAQLALSYHQAVGGRTTPTYLSAGLMVGAGQKGFRNQGLFFDNQFNGNGFTAGLPSGENFDRTSLIHLDLSAGLNLSGAVGEHSGYSVGAAIFHLNEPNVSFMGDDTETLFTRLTLNAEGEIGLDEVLPLSILPSFVYLQQGSHDELTLGLAARYKTSDKMSFTGGFYYRNGDAFIPMLRADLADLAIALSYDLNTSELNRASNLNGGFELALIFQPSFFDQRKGCNKVFCPW